MTSHFLISGTKMKALASVSGILSKAAGSNGFRFNWDSTLVKQTAPVPPEKTLYLKIHSKSKHALIKTISEETSCNFELTNNGMNLLPVKLQEDGKSLLADLLLNVIRVQSNQNCGLNLIGRVKREQILVEFGSPNIAKPLHMGHLRSTVLGHFISKICKSAGHKVTSMCFLGDWGTQFGVLQAGLARWIDSGSVEEAIEKLDLGTLLNYYIRASAALKESSEFAQSCKSYSASLEREDPSATKIWSAVREKTLKHLESAWAPFGIHYDVIQGESEFAIKSEYTAQALSVLTQAGVATTNLDGSIHANVPSTLKSGEMARVPLVKGDGSSLYLLRDIAAAIQRMQHYDFDRMIYVVDRAQSQHFSNLFYLLSNFGYGKDVQSKRVEHVAFGKLEGMSTRGGTFVLLSDAVRDGKEFMEATRKLSPNTRWEQDKDVSTQLATSALVAYCLKCRRNRDFQFKWSEAIHPVGETGVKLQYTHARLVSLEQKLEFDHELFADPDVFLNKLDIDCILKNPIALDLTLHLTNFEDSFWASYHEFEPCILLTYLFKLCDKTSKALKELPVKTEPNPMVAETRLMLFALSRRMLATGMDIVGIKPLDQI